MKSPAWTGVARPLALLVATIVCRSAFSQVLGPPVAPQGASTNTSLYQLPDTPPSATTATQYGTFNGQVIDDGVGSATALYTGNDGSVVAKIKAGAAVQETAQASVTWYFMVLGPPEAMAMPVYVPLYFQGLGHLSIQGLQSSYGHYEDATATAAVYSSLPGLSVSPAALTNNGINNFGLSLGGNALAFQSYSITLQVNANAGGASTSAVEADLDPLITIGSDFATEGYSLVSSLVPPLYGQAPAESVPEPSTIWMLLAGGIGLMAIQMPRSRRGGGSARGRDHDAMSGYGRHRSRVGRQRTPGFLAAVVVG